MSDTGAIPPGELEGKKRLLHRLLISYNDFRQAAELSGTIMDDEMHQWHETRPSSNPRVMTNRRIHEAMNCGMVVAYARPFSGNDKRTQPKVSDLPNRFVRALTDEEREVHDLALEARDTCFAHSDSSAHGLEIGWMAREEPQNPMLIPVSTPTQAPFNREYTERLGALADKMREAVFEKRLELEKELGPIDLSLNHG